MKNYYQILGVKPTATEAEIKSSYRVLAKKYHPDVNPDDASAASKFADINEANAVLSDPQARAEYDAKLREAAAPHPSQEEIIARQRAQAQEAARQAAFRNMNMNMGGRRDAATMARMRAQAQAQAQANMAQAQIQALVNQAYQQGVTEARAQLDAEIKKLKAALATAVAENKKIKALEDSETELKRKLRDSEEDRRDLEQELFNRDREATLANTRIKELEEALSEQGGNAAKRARNENSELKAELDKAKKTIKELEREKSAIQAEKEKIEKEKSELSDNVSKLERDNKQYDLKNSAQIRLQQDKRRQLQDEIDGLNKKIDELTAELEAVRAENEQWQQYAKSEEFLSDAEKRIEAWTKKTNADKRLAKPTLYGDLGVLIWATDEEITETYNKLHKRYSGKTGDAIVAKLQKVEAAYVVLGDPDKRREYNASINITEERVEAERKLIAENESIMEEYRNQLATKEFWQRFDELTAAAMEGDAESQYTLGTIYYSGEDIDIDYEQAYFWFKEAAKQKHADAMYYLGMCYLNGHGTEKNETNGQGFIRQAAKLGSKPAQKAVKKQGQ
ncbi:MAG: DnaJ domain-containing protein [Clostridiales bacterium]|nr:DnaJ domain-containing protein [Clostridiales bacterium]